MVRIGKRPSFHDFTTPVWLDSDGDGVEDAEEALIRVL
jgi:hypothetical protein